MFQNEQVLYIQLTTTWFKLLKTRGFQHVRSIQYTCLLQHYLALAAGRWWGEGGGEHVHSLTYSFVLLIHIKIGRLIAMMKLLLRLTVQCCPLVRSSWMQGHWSQNWVITQIQSQSTCMVSPLARSIFSLGQNRGPYFRAALYLHAELIHRCVCVRHRVFITSTHANFICI